MKAWIKPVGWLVVIGCALLVVTIPALAVINAVAPWKPAVTHDRFADQYLFCVGIVNGSVEEQRSYLPFPSVLKSPRMITIVQDKEGSVSASETAFGFWFFVFVYAGACAVSYKFGVERLLKRKRLSNKKLHEVPEYGNS
jgi:hypothetical protein